MGKSAVARGLAPLVSDAASIGAQASRATEGAAPPARVLVIGYGNTTSKKDKRQGKLQQFCQGDRWRQRRNRARGIQHQPRLRQTDGRAAGSQLKRRRVELRLRDGAVIPLRDDHSLSTADGSTIADDRVLRAGNEQVHATDRDRAAGGSDDKPRRKGGHGLVLDE